MIYTNGEWSGKKETSPSEILVDSNKQSTRISRRKKGINIKILTQKSGGGIRKKQEHNIL